MDQELHITSGDENVILTCTVLGNGITVGYWERMNDGQLPTQNNMSSLTESGIITSLNLKIIRARPMHSGKYRCIAYNEVGMTRSNYATVTIKSKKVAKHYIDLIIEYVV